MDISEFREMKKNVDNAALSISIGSKVNYDSAQTIMEWVVKGKAMDAISHSMGVIIAPFMVVLVFMSGANNWLTLIAAVLAIIFVIAQVKAMRGLFRGMLSIALMGYVDLVRVEGHYQNAKMVLDSLNDPDLNESLEKEFSTAKDNIKDFCSAHKFSDDDSYVVGDFLDFCHSIISYATAEINVRKMREHPEYDRLMDMVNAGDDDEWTAHELRSAQFPSIDNPDIIRDIHLDRDINWDIINLKNASINVGEE